MNLAAGRQANMGLRLIIAGVAGSGKTTATQWMATQLALARNRVISLPPLLQKWQDKVPLVMQFRLSRFAQESGGELSLDDLIGERTSDVRRPADWLENLLQSGSAVIFFDGLDELARERRTAASAPIKEQPKRPKTAASS